MAKNLSEESRQRKLRYDADYNALHTTQVKMTLNNSTDADILAYLQTLTNKQGLIKQLIRAQMKEDGFVFETDEE